MQSKISNLSIILRPRLRRCPHHNTKSESVINRQRKHQDGRDSGTRQTPCSPRESESCPPPPGIPSGIRRAGGGEAEPQGNNLLWRHWQRALPSPRPRYTDISVSVVELKEEWRSGDLVSFHVVSFLSVGCTLKRKTRWLFNNYCEWGFFVTVGILSVFFI